jgi:hypothetical protein
MYDIADPSTLMAYGFVVLPTGTCIGDDDTSMRGVDEPIYTGTTSTSTAFVTIPYPYPFVGCISISLNDVGILSDVLSLSHVIFEVDIAYTCSVTVVPSFERFTLVNADSAELIILRTDPIAVFDDVGAVTGPTATASNDVDTEL